VIKIIRRALVKAKKYTEEQIIAVLKEGEAGAKVADLCRKYGMSGASSTITGRQSMPG
jgi:hypothetical protein